MDVHVPLLHGIEPIEREPSGASPGGDPVAHAGLFFCAYLDRSNVGMAAPTMLADLHSPMPCSGSAPACSSLVISCSKSRATSSSQHGRAPLDRPHPGDLGIVAALTAFVWNEWSFLRQPHPAGPGRGRVLPRVVLYLTWWFPSYYRTRMMGNLPVRQRGLAVHRPPVGGLLLHLHGSWGWPGWQWLYLLEGVPPVIMCLVTWMLLTDHPA